MKPIKSIRNKCPGTFGTSSAGRISPNLVHLTLCQGTNQPRHKPAISLSSRAAVQDVLHAAARAEGPTALGRRHRGAVALRRINSLRCADAMRQLVADPAYALGHIEEGFIILVRICVYTLDPYTLKHSTHVPSYRYVLVAIP